MENSELLFIYFVIGIFVGTGSPLIVAEPTLTAALAVAIFWPLFLFKYIVLGAVDVVWLAFKLFFEIV